MYVCVRVFSFSMCVCEQTWKLWPSPGQEADAASARPLWTRSRQLSAPAGGPVLYRLRVPAQSPAQRSADSLRRRRDCQRYQRHNSQFPCLSSFGCKTRRRMGHAEHSVILSSTPVRTDGGVCMVKLPSASSASFVLRFLETMCRHLQCDNLFSSQPFSHYTAYDRTKSGNDGDTDPAANNR